MFGFLTSPDKQMRDNARNWLDVADRVHNYRRDQMNDATLLDLRQKTETLRARVREKADAAKLKLAIEELEPVLARAGGRIYPHNSIREWIEFFVVAGILLIGARQFFFQPFKIPTNSMWPTYNGMVPEVHATPADEPSVGAALFRTIALGASAHRVDAPADGEIMIPIINRGAPLATPSKGRQWLVFPQKQQRYYLVVGGQTVSVSVPEDFDMSWTLKDSFAPTETDFAHMLRRAADAGRITRGRVTLDDGSEGEVAMMRTGKYVKAGERALSFDIIAGDQLFVDRMSYHFVRPKVGSGFVFRTTNIPGTLDRNGNHIDSYYIKRLAGVPGDKLEIRNGVLYRNGAPITGAQAFYDNAARNGRYRGYQNYGLLDVGKVHAVSENGYMALGDNSYNSSDSRYWGEVPRKDAVGRPLWVFYPFSSHWGPAR